MFMTWITRLLVGLGFDSKIIDTMNGKDNIFIPQLFIMLLAFSPQMPVLIEIKNNKAIAERFCIDRIELVSRFECQMVNTG